MGTYEIYHKGKKKAYRCKNCDKRSKNLNRAGLCLDCAFKLSEKENLTQTRLDFIRPKII